MIIRALAELVWLHSHTSGTESKLLRQIT